MKKIMIVDDEQRIIQAFEKAFKKHYEVISASNGEKAMELIRVEQPGLVVLDWRLNGRIEGKDILVFLKRDFPDIPVCVVTASELSVKEIKLLGADACFLKPCSDLLDRISKIYPPEH